MPGFLQGLAQTLDLQPAAQTYIQTRRRREDRDLKLEDEKRRLQEKAASLGIDITGMDRETALAAIGEFQSPEARRDRSAIDAGYSDAEAQMFDQVRQRGREQEAAELGLQTARHGMVGTPEYERAENVKIQRREEEKDREAWRSEVKAASAQGYDIENPDGTRNEEKYAAWAEIKRKTTEAILKAKEAQATYWGRDRSPSTARKAAQDTAKIDAFVPGFTAELGHYPEGPEKDKAEMWLRLFSLDPSSSNLAKVDDAIEDLRFMHESEYTKYLGVRSGQGKTKISVSPNRPDLSIGTGMATASPESTAINVPAESRAEENRFTNMSDQELQQYMIKNPGDVEAIEEARGRSAFEGVFSSAPRN